MSGKIKGITVEIGGDTTGLEKAISKVNGTVKKTQTELNEVNKLLKFNPGNADLIAQKQEVLAKQIQNTSEKLKTLKDVQSQVESQFKAGKINDEQYRAFNREVINTEQSLNNLKSQLATVGNAQQELQSKTKQLDTLFKATGTNVDQYADSLGIGLVSAIKNGKASASQLDVAIAKIGKEALGSSIDVDKMKNALKSVDDGASIKAVQKDLSNVSKEAKQAGDEVNGFGDTLSSVIGGLAAGGGIAGVVEKALDTSSLNTKIDISMNVPAESMQSVRNAISTIQTYGVDAEAALQGVQRQWALNKNASDEANTSIVKQAGVIANAYSGIDFNELIQESFEMSKSMKISQTEALGLTNHLLKIGFPAEQLDIISEYGTQLKNAGYNATEIQKIMAAGVETGTWNIDNLLDGLKEGRIRMAEFGQSVPKSTQALLKGTDISSKQLQKWGQDVAKGGKTGSQAMTDVAKALVNVKDETKRNALGVAIFGTMYEDQGKNITDTLLNASKKTSDLKKNQDDLNNSIKQMNADPATKMKQAFTDVQNALTPLLTKVAEIIAKVAEWVSNNSTLAAVIAAVVTAIGLIVAGFMALAPIFSVISSLMAGLGIAFSTIAAPIAIAIAAIVALVAVGVALWKNWDSVKSFLSTIWEGIKTTATTVFSAIGNSIKDVWNGIKIFTSTVWNGIKSFISSLWNGIKSLASSAFNGVKTVITTIWNGIKSVTSSVWNGIKSVVSGVWNGLKSLASGVFNGIKSVVSSVWNGIKSVTNSVWNGIKSVVANVWNGIKSTTSNVLSGIKSVISNIFGSFKSVVSNAMNNVKSAVENGWNKAKNFLSGINLSTIGKNIIQGLVNGITNAAGAVKTAVQNIANGIPKAMRKLLGIHSPSRVMRDDVGYWITEGLAKGISANTNAEKAAKKKAQQIIKSFNSDLKKLKTNYSAGKINTEEYIKSLEDLKKKYKIYSDGVSAIDVEVSNKKKQVNDQKKKIDEDYLSKVQELNQKYIDEEKRLTEEYTKAVDDRAKSLYDFAGLFDQVNTNSEVTGQQLLDNLKGQVTTFEEWQQSIANLKSRGVSDGLISELQQMGPKSAAEVAALNTLTNEQLTEYQSLWKTKSELARTEAEKELAPLKANTEKQIEELKASTVVKLEEYQTEWKNSMSKVTKVTKNEMKNMPSIGSYAVQGLIDGMNAKKSELATVAAEIASLVASTTQSELDIHSPSRVMKKLGEYTNEGFIVGLQASAAKLKNAMSNMYGSLANSAQTMMNVGSSTVTSSTNSYDYSKNPSYTVHVDAVSDTQIARVVRREFEAMAFKG